MMMPSTSSLFLFEKMMIILLALLLYFASETTLLVEAKTAAPAAFVFFRNDSILRSNNNSRARQRQEPPILTESASASARSRRSTDSSSLTLAAAAASGGGTGTAGTWGGGDDSSKRERNSGGGSSEALFTQVISDVDDTIKSSGGLEVAGVALGGIDVQYARGDFYPGVFEFMLQMTLSGCGGCGSSSSASAPPTPPKVAILTARAEEFKLALELKDDSKLAMAFRQAGTAAGISAWGLGPVLYGSVAEWIAQSRKGLRKFANFERLLQQDPTGTILQYVYVGDTGELDQEAGETMLREYPELVKAVFLHCVSSEKVLQLQQPQQDDNGNGGTGNVYANIVDIPPPKLINGRPIIFFRTYVGAAVAAVQLGFMTLPGLQAVVDAAVQALAHVSRTSDKWLDLQRDIDGANALLEMR
jgi:hypothetical protein